VAVDEDIYPAEPELLIWAMTYSIHSPQDSVRYYRRWGPGLDPSGAPPDGRQIELTPLTTGLINAVRPWEYPPVALPAKPFMERAHELWQKTPGAPRLSLRQPWHGYELGYWPQQYADIAQTMLKGGFLEAGEMLVEYQTPITDERAAAMTHDIVPGRG